MPQVGVANFYLDIGVRDPGAPNDFIAAIECDGASYHSSKSARDRDRLRQEILENLGWDIIRIWSTDWFHNPASELSRVSAELRRLIAARAVSRASTPARPAIAVVPARSAIVSTPPVPAKSVKGAVVLPAPVAMVPAKPRADELSRDQARAELIDLRENVIKAELPDADPARGLLRKSMLDELIRKRPTSRGEFLGKIPIELRENTDAEQLKRYGERVFEILERTV